jgi:hypothetical protein
LIYVPHYAMFHNMRNNGARGTSDERAAEKAVGRRLPPGWSAELRPGSRGGRLFAIQAPDGRRTYLAIQSRKRVSPRDIPNLIRQSGGPGSKILVVAPFLSPRSRELLAEAGASYADATGNLRIVVSDPAVFLEGRGEDRDPARRPRALRSLKGSAAGRVVRALCDFLPPFGVRLLAKISSTPLGTISRVVNLLEEEALLTRGDKKQVASVDWPALINRWVRDYEVRTSNRMRSYLEPRGLSALGTKLASLERYAITGSMAGSNVAPARLAMIYVDDIDAAASTLDLAPTEAGANVWLLEPYDEVVFERTQPLPLGAGKQRDTIVAAAPSQVAADLLTSPGRGPQEGQALIEKMKETEEGWRHDSRS